MLEALRGKGWRVFGFFLWMLGTGIVLDGDAFAFGSLLLGVGMAAFLGGIVQGSRLPQEPPP